MYIHNYEYTKDWKVCINKFTTCILTYMYIHICIYVCVFITNNGGKMGQQS